MSSKRMRSSGEDDVVPSIPSQLISETVVMPPKIAVNQVIEVNDSSTEVVKTITSKTEIATYSAESDVTTPIVVPISNTGDATFDGYPLLTDPKSLRVDFEVELAELDTNQYVPGGEYAPGMIVNGDFSDSVVATDWVVSGNVTIAGGRLVMNSPGTEVSITSRNPIPTVIGTAYVVRFDYYDYQNTDTTVSYGAGNAQGDFSFYEGGDFITLLPSTDSDYRMGFMFTATESAAYITLKFTATTSDILYIDNIGMGEAVIGTDLIVNGDFSQALTEGWTASGTGTSAIVSEELNMSADLTHTAIVRHDSITAVQSLHLLTFEITTMGATGSELNVYYSFLNVSLGTFTTAGIKKIYLYKGGTFDFIFTNIEAASTTIKIDDVTMTSLGYSPKLTYNNGSWTEGLSSQLTVPHHIYIGAGGDDSYTSTKLRLNRNLPTNMNSYMGASGDTIGTDTPSNGEAELYARQGGDAYYPPSCSSYPTRLEPFAWIEISFPSSDNAKTIRINDPAKIKTHFANIVKQKNQKINYESTKWNTKFKRIGTNDLVPSEDLTYDKDPIRYASGEWFEDLAVGDKAVYTVYIADIAEEFNKDELLYLPNLQVTFLLKPEFRTLFVKHTGPACTVNSLSMPKIAYPHTLVPDISNANVLDLTYLTDAIIDTTDSISPTINTVTGSYFNINGVSCSYDTYYSKRIPSIPQFFNAFQRLSINTKFVPALHSGNTLLIKDTHFGNPKGVFIFPEIDLTLEESSVDTTAFFSRRWTESLPFQFKNVQLDVDGAKYPTDEIYKPYSMNTYSGIKREYLDMLRKAWDVTQSDLDMFDPHTERQLPLLYVPFDPVVRDMNKANDNILSGSVNHNSQYDYHIEFSTTDELEWGSTHNTALRNTKFILAYVQDYSVTMYGNHVESTAH